MFTEYIEEALKRAKTYLPLILTKGYKCRFISENIESCRHYQRRRVT